jgi:hypothetical protein|tara:strand:- start:3982 stop:4293 length:312 start_codon:yes stop_codon:yes gene_type:complete
MANTFSVNLYPLPSPSATLQKLAVSTAAVPFAARFYDGKTKFVLFEVQTGGVYATFDGSTPSSTNGHLYAVNTREFWSAGMADSAKFIRATVDAVVYGSPFTC